MFGFVTPGPDGQPVLARIVLTCCAADRRPVNVGLGGKAPTGLADGSWIQVEGAYSSQTGSDPINKAKVPYLAVTSWQEIATPQDPYDWGAEFFGLGVHRRTDDQRPAGRPPAGRNCC
jgi:uncharacterized repeat protein (TIGR03943 family)